ncbi:MAG: PEPxxWA-CTERM sorting domain-containing protein [Phycisphaerales bacterium]|jgi:hypothetical protein|nr:PEPxxWA-CTERM sorting domain-containing protein [Phycisphaerales bacterium]
MKLPTILLSLISAAGLAHGQSIGINFTNNVGGTLAPAASAGVVAQSNWNNVGATTATDLIDSLGSTTTVDLAVSNAFNIWGTGAGTATPDEQLMTQAFQWGSAAGGGGRVATFTFSQIAYPTYDVYVYSPLAISYPAIQQSVKVGSTTYWLGGTAGAAAAPFAGPGDYRQSTATTRSAAVLQHPANYVVFSGLSGASFAMQVESAILGRIAGVQIVSVSPVPEPGTWALMLAGLGVVAFVSRRKKAKATAPA